MSRLPGSLNEHNGSEKLLAKLAQVRIDVITNFLSWAVT
jgi:hypothetical protein